MNKILVIAGTFSVLLLPLYAQQQTSKDLKATREIKVISSAGARAWRTRALRGPSRTSRSWRWRFSIGAATSSSLTPWKARR